MSEPHVLVLSSLGQGLSPLQEDVADKGSDQNAFPNHAFACEGILSHRDLGQACEIDRQWEFDE